MGQGRCTGSRRGARRRRPPRPPGVSYRVSALPRGLLEQPGLLAVLGPWSVGRPLPVGPTGGPGGPVPRQWTLVALQRQLPGPLRASPPCPPGPPRGRPPGVGGTGHMGHGRGISVPSPGGCGRPLPCLPRGRRRASLATPGVPASPHLCSTCLHIEGISSAPWPPVPGRAAPTFGWRRPAPGRRAGWPAEPCVVPARGPGPFGDPGRRRAPCLPAATLASAWHRFGGRACPSIAGRGRPVASGVLWSGPPAGALGRLGAPLPATPPASLPWRCPSGRLGAEERGVRPPASALTMMRAQSATGITASGPGMRSGSQMAMCVSAGLNMQTTHCGFCCPRSATAGMAARQACVTGPAWRSVMSVALMTSPCHSARRCASWSGLQTSVGGLAHPGSCLLLGALMVCSRTASGQGAAVI